MKYLCWKRKEGVFGVKLKIKHQWTEFSAACTSFDMQPCLKPSCKTNTNIDIHNFSTHGLLSIFVKSNKLIIKCALYMSIHRTYPIRIQLLPWDYPTKKSFVFCDKQTYFEKMPPESCSFKVTFSFCIGKFEAISGWQELEAVASPTFKSAQTSAKKGNSS